MQSPELASLRSNMQYHLHLIYRDIAASLRRQMLIIKRKGYKMDIYAVELLLLITSGEVHLWKARHECSPKSIGIKNTLELID